MNSDALQFENAEMIFREHLNSLGQKQTEPRRTILRCFVQVSRPVTMQQFFSLVKQLDITIGYTTVQRALQIMVECGLARRINSQPPRFEPAASAEAEHQAR